MANRGAEEAQALQGHGGVGLRRSSDEGKNRRMGLWGPQGLGNKTQGVSGSGGGLGVPGQVGLC